MNYEEMIVLIYVVVFIVAIFLLTLSTTSKKSKVSNSKYGKLYEWSVVFLVFGCIVASIFGISIFINWTNRTNTVSSAHADGFTIEKYNIVMNVNESNSIDVKEYITIHFYESGHHGIYRFIPSWLEYTNKEGITQSREAKITNLKAVGEQYTIDTVSGKKRIKIGSPDYTLPVGDYTYEIDYTYNMGADPYDNFDEFIFHAFGDYWGTEIKNASLMIRLPKSFDTQNTIKFYAGKYRREDITSFVDYEVEGNTIYARLSPNYNLNTALTVDIELPEGYFARTSSIYGIQSFLLCTFCILMAIIVFLLWKKNGKDLDKIPETVEFYPPENLDAAEIGYLYKKDTGRKLAIALIVELASKGFIKIVESEDANGKKTQTIMKTNSTDVNKYIKREIKIVKEKDYKPTFFEILSTDFSNIMKEYFPDNGTEAIVTSNFDEFYLQSEKLVKKGYIRIESDSINQYSEQQLKEIKEKLEIEEFKDKPKMSINEEMVYNKLFESSEETVLSENRTFYTVFNKISENVRNTYDDKINDLVAYKCMLISSIGFLISTICLGLAYCVVKDLNPKYSILYCVAFIAVILIFFFSILMKRKNSYGEQISAKINGFKNYIELAEKNQLDMLVNEHPNYFYEILPYAYVLDVSKTWIEKFENIPQPTSDMGNFDYHDIGAIDNLSSSVHGPSSSSSGGCSSCGGGCSSCGGGCSSCGGGGSW